MIYRKEIDGLRAIALIPVILFHAGFKSFSGGYIGVDVFFVLSGYLITSKILAEKEAGTFSFIQFYERRARRILPALFFVMAVCIPFACLSMLDIVQLKQFLTSLVTITLFVSNIQFWQEGGYFGPAVELKPLLHTWSLAIEEQYYLIFPIFMVVFWSWGKRWLVVMVSIVAVFSLLCAQLSGNLTIYPPYIEPQFLWFNQSNLASFYLPTGRVWTLLIGVLVAFFLHSNPQTNSRINNSASSLGLFLITYSIFWFGSTTPYPSVYTLVPSIGTALIIVFAKPNTVVYNLLSFKGLVGIGLISYSAYLWHQPLFAFSRIIILEELSLWLMGLLSVISLVLGYFSWLFIERPFRDKLKIPRKQIFNAGALASLFFIGFGLLSFFGFEKVGFSDKAKNYLNQYKGLELAKPFYLKECGFPVPQKIIKESCYTPDSNQDIILLWGDSYVQALGYGLRKNFGEAYFFAQVASASCLPALNFNDYKTLNSIKKEVFCDKSNGFATSLVKSTQIKSIIFAQSSGHNETDWEEIATFARKNGVNDIYLIGPPPKWNLSLPYVLAYYDLFNSKSTYKNLNKSIMKSIMETDKKLSIRFAKNPRITYVPLTQALCSQRGCLIQIPNAPLNDNTLHFDDGHLSNSGSDFVAREIISNFLKE
jgi:peptidoglycan/LPS O-acetylase OafA/YrhL